MTLDEAKQELADPTGNSPHKVVEAARVLLDALRAAEAQVAQSVGAEAMREAAAKVVIHFRHESPETIARQIRALPVPSARTSEPAAPTPGPMRGGGGGAGRDFPESERPVRVQGPTPGPTKRCPARGDAFSELGEQCPDCAGREASVYAKPFDCEAALIAMKVAMEEAVNAACHGRSPVTTGDLNCVFEAGLAAGRRGTR